MGIENRNDWINSEKANNVVNALFNFQTSKFGKEEIINKSHHINFCDYLMNGETFATFVHNPMNEYFNIYINLRMMCGKLGELRAKKIIAEAKERGIITDDREIISIGGVWMLQTMDEKMDENGESAVYYYRLRIEEDGFFSLCQELSDNYLVWKQVWISMK